MRVLTSPFLAVALKWSVVFLAPIFTTIGIVQSSVALPEEQIADKLAGIPVYVMSNGDGVITITQTESEATQQTNIYAFMSRQDALTFLTRANAANPNFAPSAEIGLIDLEHLYQGVQSSDEQSLQIVYVPTEDSIVQARKIDPSYEGGVPLFVPLLEDGSMAPLGGARDGKETLRVFLSSDDLDSWLNRLEDSNPETRADIQEGIISLEYLLNFLQSSDDERLSQLRLLPDSETMNLIEAQNPEQHQALVRNHFETWFGFWGVE